MQEQNKGIPEDFGPRLRFFREKRGLSQGELGSRVGLSAQSVSDQERGVAKRPPPPTVIQRLAEELGCSAEHLLFGPRLIPGKPEGVNEPPGSFGDRPMIALPHQPDDQRPVRREDIEGYFSKFLDEAEKSQSRLGWVYEEVRDKFPLGKWRKKKADDEE